MDIEELYQTFKKRLIEEVKVEGFSWDGVVHGNLVGEKLPLKSYSQEELVDIIVKERMKDIYRDLA